MASKLGVVLVHGAWHSPAHFENVTSKLRAEGYAVEVPALPSVAEVAAEDVLAKDVATIKRAIYTIADTGRNVLVIMHSYGGVCGSEAVAEFQEEMEASTNPARGRIVHLLYISAMLFEAGTNPADQPRVSHEVELKDGVLIHQNPLYRFYNTTPPEVASRAIEMLLPHALESFSTPLRYTGWADYGLPLTFIVCLQDQALPLEPDIQGVLRRIEDAKLKDFTRVDIDCDHSPWISSGQDQFFGILAGILEKASKA